MSKIVLKSKERKMIEEILKKNYATIYELSAKFQVDPITIKRWVAGDNVPKYSTRVAIARLYDGYKNAKTKGAEWV